MTKKRAFLTTVIESEPVESTVTLREFENGNCNVTLSSGRAIKIPASVMVTLKRLQRFNDMVEFYKASNFWVAGPENCQFKQWEKAKGDPRCCEEFASVLEYCEVLEAMGAREAATLKTFAGVRLIGGSQAFRQWRRNNYPALGAAASEAARQKLNRGTG